MKKAIISCLLVFIFAAISLVGCDKAGVPMISNNIKEVEHGIGNSVIFQIELNGGKVRSVKRENTELTEKDYVASVNQLKINAAYVKNLAIGEHNFTINTNGGSCSFKINVADSTINIPQILNEVKAFDMENPSDIICDIAWGKGEFDKLILGGRELVLDVDVIVDVNSITIKKEALSSNTEGEYSCKLSTNTGECDFKLYIIDSSKYTKDFDDNLMIDRENFAITFSKCEIVNGFSNKVASIRGNGTLLYFNRTGYTGLDYTFKQNAIYELSYRFKYSSNILGEPVLPKQNSTGDWNIFGGRKDIMFAFANSDWSDKYGYIQCDSLGELSYINISGIEEYSNIEKVNDVYTVKVRFAAKKNQGLQIPVWMDIDVQLDNISLIKVG